jgi:16S rRNA processing protein RimM
VNDRVADWVTIAILGKPRGNKGEVLAISLSDSPGRLESLKRVFLFRNDSEVGEREVERAWSHEGRPVLKFVGVNGISEAETLQGCEVRVPMTERAPLEPGVVYVSDVMDCELIEQGSGKSLGRVTGWEDNGRQSLLEIDGDWLVPFTPALCKEVDVEGKRIVVELPEGLRELNVR